MEKKKIQNVLKRVMAIALSLLLAFSGFQLTGLRAQAAEFNFDNCISDVTCGGIDFILVEWGALRVDAVKNLRQVSSSP